MERLEIYNLNKWKQKSGRKPLMLRGTRQVGKTWLMKEFGKKNFEQTIYFNFEKNKRLKSIFDTDYDVERIITALEIECGKKITEGKSLIILDEIQEAPNAITALKYFCENLPGYHIITAGSLLGVSIHQGTSFPVGKVEFLDLYPMNFTEFLMAAGEMGLIQLIENQDWKLISMFKDKFINLLKTYFYTGGMPAVVQNYLHNKDLVEVRKVQEEILKSYENDFSKHVPPPLYSRLTMVWNSIPAQLFKENKKFLYGLLKTGARAKEFETAIQWLINCGLVNKVNRITKPAFPLKAYEDYNSFKLFMIDSGLLGAMTKLDARIILEGDSLFTEFRGALAEQYINQELRTINTTDVYYWASERGNAETDFVIQYKNKIIPVEVKAGENRQSKSLKVFHNTFNPHVSVRTSLSDFRNDGWLINIPLFTFSIITHLKEINS